MFTGLIQEVGQITRIEANDHETKFAIYAPLTGPKLSIGSSIAVNGTCLTVIDQDLTHSTFSVQAVPVTLEKTTLGSLCISSKVNLELPLSAQDLLGGHIVSGHINGIGKIAKIEQCNDAYIMYIEVPQTIQQYIIKEGSVALDGISLTVADCSAGSLVVSIIPHTLEVTTLKEKKCGDYLNIETDIFARYIEKYMQNINYR